MTQTSCIIKDEDWGSDPTESKAALDFVLPGKRHLVASPEHNLRMKSHVGMLSQILTQPHANISPPPNPNLISVLTLPQSTAPGSSCSAAAAAEHSVCLLWRQSDTGHLGSVTCGEQPYLCGPLYCRWRPVFKAILLSSICPAVRTACRVDPYLPSVDLTPKALKDSFVDMQRQRGGRDLERFVKCFFSK